MPDSKIYYDPFSGNIMVWDENGEEWVVQPTLPVNVEKHWRLKEYLWAVKLIHNMAREQITKIFKETGEVLYFNE